MDCIVALPPKLFLNTQIPACLWFISNKRHGFNGDRKREGEILFIDAKDLGHLINRKTREFSDEDIAKIAGTYHEWRIEGGKYQDIAGFCCSASIKDVAEFEYVLNPGRYVGIPEEDDDFDFEERFTTLRKELEEQLEEESRLNKRILKNLDKIILPSHDIQSSHRPEDKQ